MAALLYLLVLLNSLVVAQSRYPTDDQLRQQRICSLSGGLDVVRLFSSTTRLAFQGALEDVELVRQYIALAAANSRGTNNTIISLEELSLTLDSEARNSTASTTLEADLGYADDRPNRTIERYVSLVGQPFVGTKETDLALIEPTANVFPTIVDRTGASATATANYASENTASDERLYVAAWIGTRGEAWMYYPALHTSNGHPLSFGDVLGPAYNSQEEEFVKPNLPPARISKPYFTRPYPDTAIPGLSLITAQAPVYYTGEFMGYSYPEETYIASIGVDISVARMSSLLLDSLQGTLTEGSFAFVAGVTDLHVVLISQNVVEKIYPPRTGMEESRVTFDPNGDIVKDRRNQTYQVSDTILQDPTNLTNADWKLLCDHVNNTRSGERSSTLMNITLTGDNRPTPFYVIFERWAEVADWALLVFIPQEELDNAIQVQMEGSAGSVSISTKDLHLDIPEGTVMETQMVIHNTGTLDVTVSLKKLPPWFTYIPSANAQSHTRDAAADDEYDESSNDYRSIKLKIPAGETLPLQFLVSTEGVTGTATSLVAVTVADDGYYDCFYEEVLTANVLMNIVYEENLNQLGYMRIYGFILSAITAISALGWSVWVIRNKSVHRVVRASQPIFLHMICAGILLMGLSLIPLSIDDGLVDENGCNIACMAFPWLLSMGFCVAFSALFSKIWRINQIVAACKNYKRIHLSTRDVMVPFVIIFSLNVTILGVWTIVDPMAWVRDNGGDVHNDDFNSYGGCSLNGSAFSIVCLSCLLLVDFSAVLLATVQLYRARELSTEYSESKHIAMSLASMLQVFLTGLPILALVTDSPQVSYFMTCTVVFTMAMSLLLLIFVPKLYIVINATGTSQGSTSRYQKSAAPEQGLSGGSGGGKLQPRVSPFRCGAVSAMSLSEQSSANNSNDDGRDVNVIDKLALSMSNPSSRRKVSDSVLSSELAFDDCGPEERWWTTGYQETISEQDEAVQNTASPPKLPTRLPTVVMDDNSDPTHLERTGASFEAPETSDDIERPYEKTPVKVSVKRSSSSSTNAALPRRMPSVAEER